METPVCVYLALPAAPCSRSSGVGRGVYSARRARAAGAPPRAARAGRGRRDPHGSRRKGGDACGLDATPSQSRRRPTADAQTHGCSSFHVDGAQHFSGWRQLRSAQAQLAPIGTSASCCATLSSRSTAASRGSAPRRAQVHNGHAVCMQRARCGRGSAPRRPRDGAG